MKLSNDLKWNKIKAIEEKLATHWDYYINLHSEDLYNIAKKKADLEVWILANQIYDIATEGLENLAEEVKYSEHPIHWSQLLKIINSLGSHSWGLRGHKFITSMIEEY